MCPVAPLVTDEIDDAPTVDLTLPAPEPVEEPPADPADEPVSILNALHGCA